MIPEQTLIGFPLFGDNATKVEPDNNKKSNGWQQGDVVPAEWMNWEWYHASKGVADLNKGVNSMEKELNAVLASFGITPAELTNNQLLTAMRLNASFIIGSNTTLTGPALVSDGTIRVMFTADITGSDTTTGLTISYNGQNIPVKITKNGSLADFTAQKTSSSTYTYLQAYTALELFYDGVQFIIIGNPIIYSDGDYTFYADKTKTINSLKPFYTYKSTTSANVTFDMPASFSEIKAFTVLSYGSYSGQSGLGYVFINQNTWTTKTVVGGISVTGYNPSTRKLSLSVSSAQFGEVTIMVIPSVNTR